jgi:hypothetical protein
MLRHTKRRRRQRLLYKSTSRRRPCEQDFGLLASALPALGRLTIGRRLTTCPTFRAIVAL